jgi:hypothetical protein
MEFGGGGQQGLAGQGLVQSLLALVLGPHRDLNAGMVHVEEQRLVQ